MGKLHVLYVCSGNINRSWAAEVLTKRLYGNNVEVKSCGLGKTAGRGVRRNRKMRIALGREDDATRSQPMTAELCQWVIEEGLENALIVYMKDKYYRDACRRFGESLSDIPHLIWNIGDPQFGEHSFDGVVDRLHNEIKKELRFES